MPFYQYILTIREEIACLFILIYIAWTYYSVKRKNTYAHNLFSFLNIISIINLAMDALTIYTVNNLDTIPPVLNHILHIIFVGTFPVILYTTYAYIKSLAFHIEKHRTTFREIFPLIIALIGVATLPMYYVETPYSNYSSGPADTVAYVCAFIYFSLSVWILLRYRSQLEDKAFRGIATSLVSMVTVVIMQGLVEQLLITGIAVTLINVALYYTVESPDSVLIEKLAYERERADEANMAKSAFLARMSHEIRTPINAVLGMDEMILRESTEKNILSYARDIQATGRTLLSLINELLDFSKNDSSADETDADDSNAGQSYLEDADDGSEEFTYHELFHAPHARILVIDDTEINLTVITRLLKQTEIQIDTADSGRDALLKATEHHYDLCLVDHMMPGMDGIETMNGLKDISGTRDAVFIVLTANAIQGARESYLKEGFDDYLSKPVSGIVLEKTLLKYLPQELVEEVKNPLKSGTNDDRDAFEIEGIDTQSGIEYTGSAEAYRDVLELFYNTLNTKADEIERFYDNEDWESYKIKVHALKSSARIIGAGELSLKAAAMEEAADKGDIDAIKKDTVPLLKQYRSYYERLSVIFEEKKDNPPIDEGMLKEAYRSINEFANNMDYGLTEMVLQDISGYSLPASDEERINAIKKKLTDLDWDGIIELTEEIKGI
ncbi:MAG: response regulator [Lachnospiraceae bacterium]|nr:response regulator [Lachnospiraceae bacterium]